MVRMARLLAARVRMAEEAVEVDIRTKTIHLVEGKTDLIAQNIFLEMLPWISPVAVAVAGFVQAQTSLAMVDILTEVKGGIPFLPNTMHQFLERLPVVAAVAMVLVGKVSSLPATAAWGAYISASTFKEG